MERERIGLNKKQRGQGGNRVKPNERVDNSGCNNV